MVAYADTSFLVATYIIQPESSHALAYMQKETDPLPFTPFHRLELRNAIRLSVFRKEISADTCRQAFREVENDLADGILVHQPIAWTDAFQRAEELGASYSETSRIRSGDIFLVACALQYRTEVFLTFDIKQRELARMAGLKTIF